MKFFTRLFTIWVLISIPLMAQEFDLELSSEIPKDPAITFGTFENGFTFYIKENTKPENRASLHLVINVGSVLETDAQQGLAHLAEHMAFNGTKNFAKHELVDYLESIGMQFGPEINAYTSFDETVYMLQVPTDSVEIMDNAFQILEDWAHQVSYDPEEIDKERKVVIEEWRLGRGADARMQDAQLPILFKDSQYANRLPIGKVEVLENFPHKEITDFYETWYRPDLMAIVAIGDFETETILNYIKKHFESLENPKDAPARVNYEIPDHDEPLFAIATDPEATGTEVSLYFKRDTEQAQTVADYRKSLVEQLYNAMLNNRFYELRQSENPPFLGAASGKGSLVRAKDTYYLGSAVKQDGIEKGLETLLIESKRVKQHGFTQTELDRVKMDLLRGLEKANKERNKTQSIRYAREFTRNFLTDEPIPGIAYEFALAQKYVPGISVEEVNELASDFITDKNRVVMISAPDKEDAPVPSEETLQTIFDRVDKMDVEPYDDQVSDEPLIADELVPGKIVDEKTFKDLDVNIWTLSNGIKVVSKKTDFKNDEILFKAFSFGGDSHADDKDYVPASTAATLVSQGGLGDFNLIELDKKLTGKVARVYPFIEKSVEGLSGSCSPDDFELLFQLAHLHFTAPRKDETAFKAYKQRMEGYLQNRSSRPETAFTDTLRMTMAMNHLRARPWTMELLNEMDLDKSFEFYKERFSNPADFTFYFVGSFDTEKLATFSEKYLASLPGKQSKESWKDVDIKRPQGVVEKNIYKGIEQKSRVGLFFSGTYKWSPETVFKINAVADILRIKLREVLREDMGGTYGVGVSTQTNHYPREEYFVNVSWGCDPTRVDEMVESVFIQVDSLQQFGPEEKYMQKIKETYVREWETNLKENGFWMSKLYGADVNGISYDKFYNHTKSVEKLSTKDIQKTAKAFLNKENYVKIILYPEKGGE